MEDEESTGDWFEGDDEDMDNSNLVLFGLFFSVIVLGAISIALIIHHRRKVKRSQFIDTGTGLGDFGDIANDAFTSEEEGGDGILGTGPDVY